MASRATGTDGTGQPDWDLDRVFDETYLDFYETVLTSAWTSAECDRILRLLGSRPGGRLLDLCCGHGRHARELAARGLEVVAVDRSAGFLRRAAESAPPAARFVRADVGALPLADEHFDGAYCWFSSIGYRGPAEDLAMLREAWRVLVPGLRLAVETRNWATVAAGEIVVETPRGRIVDHVERDEVHGRLRTLRRYEPDRGELREVEFSLHLYDADAFVRLLEAAGFVAVAALDGEDRPFSEGADRVAFVARRPAGGR
jgi:SAM-dependent methyltransferase